MTDGKSDRKINEVNYSDIPNIAPYALQNERIKNFSKSKDEYLKVPLLDDVLKSIPIDITINVEFKQGNMAYKLEYYPRDKY